MEVIRCFFFFIHIPKLIVEFCPGGRDGLGCMYVWMLLLKVVCKLYVYYSSRIMRSKKGRSYILYTSGARGVDLLFSV